MIDFSRTFCDLHPNELISNFCCKGTSYFIQRNATLDYALHAFAVTLKVTYNAKQLQTIKIYELLTAKCKKILEPEYLPLKTKRQES